MNNKIILITGTSNGFGKLSVLHLLEQGHTVIATMRDPEGKNSTYADELQKAGAHIINIDVTNEDSVNEGMKEAFQIGNIDVLINNAGIGSFGPQESFSVEDMTKIFDVNVFGVQRMNRAILPHFRENGSGLIIYISSIAGRQVSSPLSGAYTASKHALEAMAETYASEISGFNIESVIVEPGAFATNIFSDVAAGSDEERTVPYAKLSKQFTRIMDVFMTNLKSEDAPNPNLVAQAIGKIIQTPTGRRTFRVVVDPILGEYIEKINTNYESAVKEIKDTQELMFLKSMQQMLGV